MRTAIDRAIGPAVFVLALGAGLAAFAVAGRWDRPPIPGDTQDYDNIALNLRHARGFGQDWDDPEWRAPYEAHNQGDLYTGILARHGGYAPTAYRPPLLPLLLAASYSVFGRSFLAWGLIHCGIVALTIALAAVLALRTAGRATAAIAVLLLLGDGSFRAATFLSPYLTEGITCLGVVLFALALVRLAREERPRTRSYALAGALLGLLALARTIFVLWYPPALLLAWLLASRRASGAAPSAGSAPPAGSGPAAGSGPGRPASAVPATRDPADGERQRRGPGTARALGAFLAFALLVPLPLWTRNCLVLGRFMPLGTQGGRNLPMGYSDEALASGGVWTAEASTSWWAVNGAGTEIGDPLTVEGTQAELGQRETLRWIASHPARVPGLVLGKLRDLWRRPLPGRYGWAIALFALAGLPMAWHRPALGVLWAVLAFESLAVAATYADGSRFLIPVLPILDVLIAAGLCRLVAGIAESASGRAGHKASRFAPSAR